MSETTSASKKKSSSKSKRSSEKEKEKELSSSVINTSNDGDEEMSEPSTPTIEKKEKERKKKSSSSSSSSSKTRAERGDKSGADKSTTVTSSTSSTTTSEKDTGAGHISSMQVEESTQSVTTSSNLNNNNVSKTPTHSNANGSGITASSLPMTPLTKMFGLGSIGTPLQSPSRLSINRMKEKEELTEVTKKLSKILTILEERNNEIVRLKAELNDSNKSSSVEVSALRTRLDETENRLTQEIKQRAEAASTLELTLADLKNKEDLYMHDRNTFDARLEDTISSITKEHSAQLTVLRTDLNKRLHEIEQLKGDIKLLNADLLTKSKEQDERTHRLLDAEYKRMKQKEDELLNLISQKDDDIKKVKLTLKEKEKIIIANQRKEAELNQTVEAFERQVEDIRDSINREWEIKVAEAIEEQTSKYASLEMTAKSFDFERETFRNQIAVIQQQTEDLNVKNHELSDRILDLSNELRNKEQQIITLTAEQEELKKNLRRSQAELKSKDGKLSLLQDEISSKEIKFQQYQSEMHTLKKELHSANNQSMDPEIPIGDEIRRIKELVNTLTHQSRPHKRQRSGEYSGENNNNNGNELAANHEEEMSDAEQQSPSSTSNSVEPAASTLKLNTMCILSIDTTKETIRLNASGDHVNGMTITDWKIIVNKPDGFKYGFQFPANITPLKGINVITLHTGRSRALNTTAAENEFYWSRTGIWDSPEGTTIQLVSPKEVLQESVSLTNGAYVREESNPKEQGNCLIM